MEKLKNLIKTAATAYYSNGENIMTDMEFDSLIEELKELDPDDELLTTVGWGGKPEANGRVLRPHRKKLYTIDTKIKDYEVAKSMINDGDIIQPKIDGISCTLYYVDGTLDAAITRGDGKFGYCIKDNINTDGIRHLVDGNGSARAEIAMRVESWKRFYDTKKNPSSRNLIAGVCGKTNATELEKSLAIPVILDIDGEIGELNDFTVIAPTIKLGEELPVGEFDNDGYVIKTLNEHNRVTKLWAYKPMGQLEETTVTGITWQVGTTTGKLTPVLHVEPVLVSGATISNVTGNSIQMMESLKCGIGSKIGIIRSGLVIPKVQEVYTESEDFNLPSYDKRVGAHLFVDIEINLYTKVMEMMSQLKNFGQSLVNKIKEFEPIDDLESLQGLIESGVNPDFFTDHECKLVEKATEMIRAMTVREFMLGLNLPNIGASAVDKLLNVEPLPSHSYKSWNENADNFYKVFMEVHDMGLVQGVEREKVVDSSAKTVVMTGKFEQSRKVMTAELEDLGYVIGSKVNKDTDILLIADVNSTSSKAKAARKHNVRIVGSIDELKED